jgi:methylisocitrate lyase
MSNVRTYQDKVRAGKTGWAAGAYDALSAKLIEEAGFDAVMTSGFAVSASLLGMPDVELYTMTENLGVARNVCNAVKSPVIADTDTGYGNAINVMRTVREFEQAGVAGVILEDQQSPKRCPACTDQIEILPIEEGIAKIRAAVASRRNPNLLIIARTDARDPREAAERGRAYAAAGADLIQPISRTFKDAAGLRAFRETVGRPLSLQLLGWLEKGLTRQDIEGMAGMATFPLVPLMTAAAALRQNLAAMARAKSSQNLPIPVVTHDSFNAFIGFKEIEELQLKYLQMPDAAE